MAAINEHSETKPRSGQQDNSSDGFIVPFLEWEEPYQDDGTGVMVTGFEGMEGYEIDPINDGVARIRLIDAAAVADLLEAIETKCAITIPRIDFPPVLLDVVTSHNTSEGAGIDDHPAANITILYSGRSGATVNPRSKAQGSAAIMPSVQPEFEERWCQNVPAVECTFYLAQTADPMADALTKLTTMMGGTVEAWMQFRPKAHTITLSGQQADVSANADTRVFGNGSDSDSVIGSEFGAGTSVSRSATIRTERWPPSIHGAITIDDTLVSADADADVDASTPELDFDTIGTVATIPNTASVSEAVEARISPGTLDATTTYTSIPSTGLRMYQLTPGPRIFGLNLYRALVVDMADL